MEREACHIKHQRGIHSDGQSMVKVQRMYITTTHQIRNCTFTSSEENMSGVSHVKLSSRVLGVVCLWLLRNPPQLLRLKVCTPYRQREHGVIDRVTEQIRWMDALRSATKVSSLHMRKLTLLGIGTAPSTLCISDSVLSHCAIIIITQSHHNFKEACIISKTFKSLFGKSA